MYSKTKRIFIWIVPALVLLIIGLWGGSVLLEWNNIDKIIPDIPNYVSYNEAVGTNLPEQLVLQAEKAGCKGYVLPISRITGSAPEGLREDLNLSLAAYPGWKILVSEGEQAEMKTRWESRVADWGSMMNGRDFQQFLTAQKSVDFNTRYSINVDFFDKLDHPVNTRKIILTVNDETTHSRLFDIAVVYTDAETISSWAAEREAKKISLAKMENKVKTTRAIIMVSVVVTGAIYFVLIILILGKVSKSGKRRKNYLQQIEKRENLINDGHYTSALELAENYLSYFPDDVEIKAFKQRILVFCGGDTQKAEEAFVHASKLKVILETAREGARRTISIEEQSQITALLPYNQNLKESYTRFLVLEDKRNAETSKQRQELLESLSKNVELKNITQARENLSALETLDPDHTEIKEWKNLLTPGPSNIILRRSDGKQLVYCVTKSDILIGRIDDDNNPDIALTSNRISRRHLQLSLVDGKLIAEDPGSANGTYVNGEKISSVPLNSGDTLNIGKVIDFTVTFGNNDAISLNSSEISICFITGLLTFPAGQRNIEIDRVEGFFLINNGKQEIIKTGQTLVIGSYKYSVEEL